MGSQGVRHTVGSPMFTYGVPTLPAAAYAVRSPAASITMAPSLPDAVSEVLPSKVAEDPGVGPLWRALRGCYPSDEAALTALTANKGIVTPWVVSPSTITSNNALLRGMLGKQRALNVITKNPGVLACDPERLAISSPRSRFSHKGGHRHFYGDV